MSVVNAIISSRILAFDVMRGQFFASGARCFLLKTRDKSGYVSIIEIESGWFVKYSNYREQTGFEFATLNADFADKFAQMTHIGYGVPTNGAIDVYEIKPDARDRIPPNGTQPTWKCFGERVTNERFYVPASVIVPSPPPEIFTP